MTKDVNLATQHPTSLACMPRRKFLIGAGAAGMAFGAAAGRAYTQITRPSNAEFSPSRDRQLQTNSSFAATIFVLRNAKIIGGSGGGERCTPDAVRRKRMGLPDPTTCHLHLDFTVRQAYTLGSPMEVDHEASLDRPRAARDHWRGLRSLRVLLRDRQS